MTQGDSNHAGLYPIDPEPGWLYTIKALHSQRALAIAVYCALVAPNFEEAVVMAVNHDGDSDSTGAIVGNLLGLIGGEQCLPQKWLEGLELREVITELADDLFDCPQWSIGMNAQSKEFDNQTWEKYPGY